MPALALQELTDRDLCAALPELSPAQARALISAVHRDRPLEPRPGLSRAALGVALARGEVPTLTLLAEEASRRDPFVKLLLATADGTGSRRCASRSSAPVAFSVCVSSQVGCALACAFCATGRLGLRAQPRGLGDRRAGAHRARAPAAPARVHGVVFQGMGEPLANLDRVLEAIARAHRAVRARPSTRAPSPSAPPACRAASAGSRARRRSVRLGRLDRQRAPRRCAAALMPIARAHPLAEVLDAAAEHARATGHAPMWAVTLLAGVNDADDDARALAALAAPSPRRPAASRPRHLDHRLQPDRRGDPFARASAASRPPSATALRAAGVRATAATRGGSDVAAACGQLAGRA